MIKIIYAEIFGRYPVSDSDLDVSVKIFLEEHESEITDRVSSPVGAKLKVNLVPQPPGSSKKPVTVREFISSRGWLIIQPEEIPEARFSFISMQASFPSPSQEWVVNEPPRDPEIASKRGGRGGGRGGGGGGGIQPAGLYFPIAYAETVGAGELPPFLRKHSVGQLLEAPWVKSNARSLAPDPELDLVFRCLPDSSSELARKAPEPCVLVHPADVNQEKCVWKRAKKVIEASAGGASDKVEPTQTIEAAEASVTEGEDQVQTEEVIEAAEASVTEGEDQVQTEERMKGVEGEMNEGLASKINNAVKAEVEAKITEGTETLEKKITEALEKKITEALEKKFTEQFVAERDKLTEAFVKERNKLKASIKLVREELRSVKKSLKAAKTKISRQVKLIKELEKKLSETTTKLAQATQREQESLQREINAVAREKNLNEDLRKIRKELTSLDSDNQKLRKDISNLEENVKLSEHTRAILVADVEPVNDLYVRKLVEQFRREMLRKLKNVLPVDEYDAIPLDSHPFSYDRMKNEHLDNPDKQWWNEQVEERGAAEAFASKLGFDGVGLPGGLSVADVLQNTRFHDIVQQRGGFAAHDRMESEHFYARVVCNANGHDKNLLKSIFRLVYGPDHNPDELNDMKYLCIGCKLHCGR